MHTSIRAETGGEAGSGISSRTALGDTAVSHLQELDESSEDSEDQERVGEYADGNSSNGDDDDGLQQLDFGSDDVVGVHSRIANQFDHNSTSAAVGSPAVADLSFRSSGGDPGSAHMLDTSGTYGEGSGSAGGVAKALLFSPPAVSLSSGTRTAAPTSGLSSSSGRGDSFHRKPFEQPPLVSFAPGTVTLASGGRAQAVAATRGATRFSSPLGARGGGPTSAQRANLSAAADWENGSQQRPVVEAKDDNGYFHDNEHRSQQNGHREGSPGQGPSSSVGEKERYLVPGVFRAADGTLFEASAAEECSPTSYSYIYKENLLHQLKVATSKNAMLEGKLRDIEQLVDRNYGTISERSRILAAERSK
jgi:hypothetical protein